MLCCEARIRFWQRDHVAVVADILYVCQICCGAQPLIAQQTRTAAGLLPGQGMGRAGYGAQP